jgi:hypothetical protein
MSWANLDDRLHAHPKVRKLQRLPFAGAEAFGIWTWCLSWCRSFSPDDGLVDPDDVALDWNADPEHMRQVFDLLLTVGLVDAVEPGGQFAIHDWADWQLDGRMHQVLAGKARAASAVRGANGRYVQPGGKGGTSHGAPPSSNSAEVAGLGTSRATPLHASPLHASPRLDDQPGDTGLSTFHETGRRLGFGKP